VRALLALRRTSFDNEYRETWKQILAIKLGVFCSDLKEIDNILKSKKKHDKTGKTEHEANETQIAADRRKFAKRLRGS